MELHIRLQQLLQMQMEILQQVLQAVQLHQNYSKLTILFLQVVVGQMADNLEKEELAVAALVATELLLVEVF
jgi:hypothetical protein